jgi:hypothetical protein
MPARKPPRDDEKPQFERSIEAAKKVEAAETDEGLLDTVRKVAKSTHPACASRPAEKRPSRR